MSGFQRVNRYSLLSLPPKGLKGQASALSAFQTANAVLVIWVLLGIYFGGTYLFILMKKPAFSTIQLHLEKADPVENGVNRTQGAGISAERLMNEDRSGHETQKYK